MLRVSSAMIGAWSLAGCGTSEPDEPPPPRLPPTACQALTSDGGGVTVGSGLRGDPAVPTPALYYESGRRAVRAQSYMAVTANPRASLAACEVLAAGGTAIDAAIAAQMVLGLVEPQSSGLGGGAFLLYYDAATRAVQAYDGRETAPAAATERYLQLVDDAGTAPVMPNARASGRSIGTPGVLRMLELAHRDHGRMTWSALFAPAIALARDGVAIGGRLSLAIATEAAGLATDAEAAATYLNSGSAKPMGATLTVPAYAATLSAIAAGGADAFYTGEIAQAIVDKIGAGGAALTPGRTALADLAGYAAQRRDALCTAYRDHVVCGMPPPSSGGIAVAQTLGMLAHFDLAASPPIAVDGEGGKPTVTAAHLVSEAERLAYADRNRYVADTDFVPLPGGSPAALLDAAYLAERAQRIQLDRSLGTAPAGAFAPALGVDRTPEHGTSQITIVDRDGNAVAMTTTIEATFGSYHMVRGVVLNNQLTDFSAEPTDDTGALIANRVAAGKRPRSSMAPTLVFHATSDGARGELAMATGSPGGATIIQYVVKTLVGVLDWGLDAQQAAALVDFGAANSPVTNVGREHPTLRAAADGDSLVVGLRALGHDISLVEQTSGVSTIVRASDGLVGGADPRREGLALGDPVAP